MLALALHLTLAATPGGVHLLEPSAVSEGLRSPLAQLSPPPMVPLDEAPGRSPLAVGEELEALTLRVRALTEKIRKLGPNWPMGPTAIVCLGLLGAYEGVVLLPLLLFTTSFIVPVIYFTVVIAVLGLGVYWGYASWAASTEERERLIKERDALQRRLDDATLAPTAPSVPSVHSGPKPALLLARF